VGVTVVLTGSGLTVEEVVRVAREAEPVELDPTAIERMLETRKIVERVVERGDVVYGMTTGVGARKKVLVAPEEIPAFNRALIANHRVATGPDAPVEIVRATIVRLANALAKGTAGVRPEIAQRLVDALNNGDHPRVRMLGSVGQADLPQTAVADMQRLVDAMDVAGALDLEAFAANVTLLHPAIGEVRPYPGIVFSLERLRTLLEGSYLWDEGAARNLQDPLTFRCLPQIQGAVRDALAFGITQLEIELNASQENPLVLPAEDRIVSVANFDVLPLAAALDFLRLTLASAITSVGERAEKLLQGPLTGLPDGLAPRQGLAENSLGEFGVPAQGLTAEARLLAHPVSFELASSTHAEGIEDRTTMAPLAARRLGEMVDLGERLLAIGLVISCQAIDLRAPERLGVGSGRAHELVRERIPFMGEGERLPADLEPLRELIRSGKLSA
jgi:histidine ammonia-lyase